jgi:hypothetical protein
MKKSRTFSRAISGSDRQTKNAERTHLTHKKHGGFADH